MRTVHPRVWGYRAWWTSLRHARLPLLRRQQQQRPRRRQHRLRAGVGIGEGSHCRLPTTQEFQFPSGVRTGCPAQPGSMRAASSATLGLLATQVQKALHKALVAKPDSQALTPLVRRTSRRGRMPPPTARHERPAKVGLGRHSATLGLCVSPPLRLGPDHVLQQVRPHSHRDCCSPRGGGGAGTAGRRGHRAGPPGVAPEGRGPGRCGVMESPSSPPWRSLACRVVCRPRAVERPGGTHGRPVERRRTAHLAAG